MKKVVEEVQEQVAQAPQQVAQNQVNPNQEVEAQREGQLRMSGVLSYLENKVQDAENKLRSKEQELAHVTSVIQKFFSKLGSVIDINSLGNLDGSDYELSIEVEPKTNKVKLIKK